MSLAFNPELRRQLWMRFSWIRVVLAVVAVAIVALILNHRDHCTDAPLGCVPVWVIFAVLGFWGVRNAAESVTQEVADGTWDNQRLSVLSPWKLLMGKFLGAPALASFTVILILPWLAYDAVKAPPIGIAKWLVLVLLTTATAQMAAIAASLVFLRRGGRPGKAANLATLLGLVVLFRLLSLNFQAFESWDGFLNASLPKYREMGLVSDLASFLFDENLIFGYLLSPADFRLISASFWLLVSTGIGYYLIRGRLGYASGPFAGVGLLALIGLWVFAQQNYALFVQISPTTISYAPDSTAPPYLFHGADILLWIASWFMLIGAFADRRQTDSLARTFLFWRHDRRSAASAMPFWFLPAIIWALALAATGFFYLRAVSSPGGASIPLASLEAIAAGLRIGRDAAIVLVITAYVRRPVMVAVVVLTLLHVFLPFIDAGISAFTNGSLIQYLTLGGPGQITEFFVDYKISNYVDDYVVSALIQMAVCLIPVGLKVRRHYGHLKRRRLEHAAL